MTRPFSADDPAVLLLDASGRVVCANVTSSVLTARGGTAEGQTLQDLVGVPQSLFRRAVSSAQRLRLTLALEQSWTSPGQTSQTTWECIAIASPAGAVEHLLLTGFRGNPRRAGREEIVAVSHRRLLPATTAEQAWAFDRGSLRFVAINAVAASRHGYAQEELAAMTVLELMSWDQVEGFLLGLTKLAPGRTVHAVSRHRDRQGRIFDLDEDYVSAEADERPVCVVLARENA